MEFIAGIDPFRAISAEKILDYIVSPNLFPAAVHRPLPLLRDKQSIQKQPHLLFSGTCCNGIWMLPSRGLKSGLLAASIGVGTATMNTLQLANGMRCQS